MKLIFTLVFVTFGFMMNGQEVILNGKHYEVKKDRIFLEGNDITATLTVEEQNDIFARFQKNTEDLKLKEKLEKEAKKAEKAQKRAEKKQKQAEKDLRKRDKAQDNYNKASKKLEQTQDKYEKLKRRGKLSPKDEAKWLGKIESLSQSLDKAKKKLKRS